MELKQFDGFKYINGGVCAAKGFKAGGINCGLNSNPDKNDLGIIFCEKKCTAAAVYTQNKVKGAPIIITQKNLADGYAQAVIANSKNANTCNADGEEKAQAMCDLTAKELKISARDVIVASTGVIGQPLNIKAIEGKIKQLADSISESGSIECAKAIMTTDTFSKEAAVLFEIGGKLCRLGGMAKGSGMIHPNMATTLNFLTTDAAISCEMLKKALSKITKTTYNRLSIDGDTSTNDMVSIMASGLAGNAEIAVENADCQTFEKALYIVMMNLTRMLAKDGEGATKLLECTVTGAKTENIAEAVAKSVIGSSLFKAAMFGSDANWGRILCAIGYADADFDITKVAVSLSSKVGKINVCKNGSGIEFSEDEAKKILLEDEIIISVNLNGGTEQATAWGCDLTYDYVKINGDYRS
ncbi:MAG: bifunctional ornithine acetyltransferase/N-acetylglutamate synthase [Oscillospiraceae bacterium]|jgi:glutamate N-acetyltransferase/amino-acid N-acetyltransferase